MGLNGRLVAKYAGSSKLSERISLIISGMIFGDMLDIAKWLRLRRKCTGRDLLPTTRLQHRHRIAGNAAVVVVAGWRIRHGAACRGGVMILRALMQKKETAPILTQSLVRCGEQGSRTLDLLLARQAL